LRETYGERFMASHGIRIFIESITVVMIAAKEKTELTVRLLRKNNALYPFSLEALRKIKFSFDELCRTK